MSAKPVVAVLAGSYTGEHEISLKSAVRVMEQMDREAFSPWLVVFKENTWWVQFPNGEELEIDASLWEFAYEGQLICFDVAYIIMHGVPGESGEVQGLLEMCGLPYTTPGVLVSSLTMNKQLTKTLVASLGIPVAKSLLYRASQTQISIDQAVEELGLPLFVKPNNGGSSLATFKVKSKTEMVEAIEKAFEVDHEVLAEGFLPGRELTMGLYTYQTNLICLPPTEIVPHNEFFDYQAKYEGQSDEITPADISAALSTQMEEYSKAIYAFLDIRGLVRMDYMLHPTEGLIFMEINTVPGFSEASIVPQQIRAAGQTETEVISRLLWEALAQG